MKCSNCAQDVDIAHMGDHVCQPSGCKCPGQFFLLCLLSIILTCSGDTSASQATGETTPPPEHELQFESKSSSSQQSVPSQEPRQEHSYLPWSSQQHDSDFDPSTKPTRLGPLPRIDPLVASKRPCPHDNLWVPERTKAIMFRGEEENRETEQKSDRRKSQKVHR